MKRFIANEGNISQIMGELNKVFMKNHYRGHHVVVGSFTRKNGKRPKTQHITGRQKQYFAVLAEHTDPMFLCDINFDTEDGFGFITAISAGDTVLIDGDRVHIISKDERIRYSNQKHVVTQVLRKYRSIIPATEGTAQEWESIIDDQLSMGANGSCWDGLFGPYTEAV